MKKAIYGLFGLLILLVSAPAQADTLYFAVQAGFSTQPTSINQTRLPGNDFELNTQAGLTEPWRWELNSACLRAEIEAVYRYNPNDKFLIRVARKGPMVV